MTKIAGRMKNIAIAGAWSRWTEMAAEAQDMRVKLTRALSKMKNRGMMVAWERWCDMLHEAG